MPAARKKYAALSIHWYPQMKRYQFESSHLSKPHESMHSKVFQVIPYTLLPLMKGRGRGESSQHQCIISAPSFFKAGINRIFEEKKKKKKNTEITKKNTMWVRTTIINTNDLLFRGSTTTNSHADDTACHFFLGDTSISIVRDEIPWNSAWLD